MNEFTNINAISAYAVHVNDSYRSNFKKWSLHNQSFNQQVAQLHTHGLHSAPPQATSFFSQTKFGFG